jgi:predicted transcriptional regulator
MPGRFRLLDLTARREAAGVSIAELARRSEVSLAVVRRLEAGGLVPTQEACRVLRALEQDASERRLAKRLASSLGLALVEEE